MDYRQVEVFAPIVDGGAAEDDLGDVFAANKFGDGVGDAVAFELYDLRAEIFAEAQVGG